MDFWRIVQTTPGLPEEFSWVVAGFLVVSLGLLYFLPAERPHVRTALTLFGLSVVGILAAAEMHVLGVRTANVFYACVSSGSLFLGGVAIANLGSVVFFAALLRPARLEPPPLAKDLMLALAYMGVAIFTLSRGGVDVRGIIATSAVLTAVIGFSLQDTLGNIMGGLALQMERTIRAGDWIRLDDIEGRVKQIRWRQTSIETRNWDTIVIPNSVLMKVKVTLLGRRTGQPVQRRQWVYFRVALSHSPTKVIHTVEMVLHGELNKNIAPEPKPHCLVTEFKDGEAVYAVRYWITDLSQTDPTDSLVRTRIFAALRRANIPLAIPTQAIHLTEENETVKERQQQEEMQRRIEALRRQELFMVLNDDERGELAPRLIEAHFVRGETIMRQGAQAHWLYIIGEGDTEVEVEHDGKSQRVATLHAGDLFGEMGLMTGEPRTATVKALTDVACYRLGKEAFEDILRNRPEIAEQMSLTLAQRRVELEEVREQLGQEAQTERIKTMQGALLRGIREFFGMQMTLQHGRESRT